MSKPLEVSVTELGLWKRCRRQWDLTSYNRRALVRGGAPPAAFAVGTALHLAFSAHVSGLEPREVVQEWLLREERHLLSKTTNLEANPELQEKLLEARNLSLDLVSHYFEYWGWDNPLKRSGLQYIAAEVPLRAPIPGADGGTLVGTIDGIAEDESGNIWLVEHKSYSQRPNRVEMDTNAQMTAYMWLFNEVFGFLPAGVLYDGVGKKLPRVPVILKNGREMSRQKIDTTAPVYLRALLDAGFDPSEYVDVLARLEDQDGQEQNPFFTRWFIEISPRSVETFSRTLQVEYAEMSTANTIYPLGTPVQETVPYLYPHFPWSGCWDCGVRDLCRAIQFQEDFEYLADTFYVRSAGHETIRSTKIEKGMLPNVHALRDHVPNVLIAMGYLV